MPAARLSVVYHHSCVKELDAIFHIAAKTSWVEVPLRFDDPVRSSQDHIGGLPFSLFPFLCVYWKETSSLTTTLDLIRNEDGKNVESRILRGLDTAFPRQRNLTLRTFTPSFSTQIPEYRIA